MVARQWHAPRPPLHPPMAQSLVLTPFDISDIFRQPHVLNIVNMPLLVQPVARLAAPRSSDYIGQHLFARAEITSMATNQPLRTLDYDRFDPYVDNPKVLGMPYSGDGVY